MNDVKEFILNGKSIPVIRYELTEDVNDVPVITIKLYPSFVEKVDNKIIVETKIKRCSNGTTR